MYKVIAVKKSTSFPGSGPMASSLSGGYVPSEMKDHLRDVDASAAAVEALGRVRLAQHGHDGRGGATGGVEGEVIRLIGATGLQNLRAALNPVRRPAPDSQPTAPASAPSADGARRVPPPVAPRRRSSDTEPAIGPAIAASAGVLPGPQSGSLFLSAPTHIVPARAQALPAASRATTPDSDGHLSEPDDRRIVTVQTVLAQILGNPENPFLKFQQQSYAEWENAKTKHAVLSADLKQNSEHMEPREISKAYRCIEKWQAAIQVLENGIGKEVERTRDRRREVTENWCDLFTALQLVLTVHDLQLRSSFSTQILEKLAPVIKANRSRHRDPQQLLLAVCQVLEHISDQVANILEMATVNKFNSSMLYHYYSQMPQYIQFLRSLTQ